MASGPAADIESARRGPANGHLLLAVLYAKAGAVDEARAELDLLAAENPNSPVVKELRASLDQATPSPIKTKAAQ
jgi:predicted Zn-dependent protease